MPEDKNKKTVDIDTSGPEVDVELEDTTKPEPEFEVKEETVREVKEEPKAKAPDASDLKPEAGDKEPVKAEVKKDELEDYSESVQRRIAKLTKKWREAERQKDEALTYAHSVKAEKEALTKKFSTLENVSLKDREAKIAAALEAAKSKLLIAREANDVSAEIEVQKEIARLGYEDGRLQELKSASENLAKEEPKRIADVRVPERKTVADPKAEAWAEKNKWFGSDKAMTYTAFDIHKTLIDEEGYDAQSEEYYAEIDKTIRLEFPHKFANNATTESTKPVQTVASAKRSTKPGRKTVRLTPSQVAIAKKLGVPLEEYAKQLNITKEV